MQRRSAILIFARSIEGISSKTTLYLKKALTKDMNWKWCNLFYRIFFSEKKTASCTLQYICFSQKNERHSGL